MSIFFRLVVLFSIGFIIFHVIRFIYHSINPEAKKEFLRKKTEKRIKADFPRYEKECRKKHEKQAEDKFSTLLLRKELGKLLSKIESEANSIFKNNILNIRSSIEKIQLEIKNKQKTIDLFSNNYKEILDNLYAEKNSLFIKKENFYNNKKILHDNLQVELIEKDEAYDDLNDSKDSIESWHNKSERTPWLLGNGGKKIPNHSMFGQSFGDLDSYKSDRDKAYHHVKSCKERIGYINSEIEQNKSDIDQVKQKIINVNSNIQKCKDERTRMYGLKKDGITRASTQVEIEKLEFTLKSEQSKLNDQISSERIFIIEKKRETGFIDLQEELKVILLKKKEFITEFDSSENNLNRVNEHRIFWFKSYK